ncbi:MULTISPECIES: hypothetical protein [unclassified Streptomyces]|uniref:hypothetical protein n=1 Tax=unclassified Streptomyces TaxID=2593676 RepID=UPI0036E95908
MTLSVAARTVGVTMFGAGVVSTTGFLTMALLALIQHPGLQAGLVADPGRIPAAVEELLRINLSIGDGLPRPALEDVVLGDVQVAAGDLVLVEGANFDPAAFPDPHAVGLDRANSAAPRHGAGPDGVHEADPGAAAGHVVAAC